MNETLTELMNGAIAQKKEIRVSFDGLGNAHLMIHLRDMFAPYIRFFMEIVERGGDYFDVIVRKEYADTKGYWNEPCPRFFTDCPVGRVNSVNRVWNARTIVEQSELKEAIQYVENRVKSVYAHPNSNMILFNQDI